MIRRKRDIQEEKEWNNEKVTNCNDIHHELSTIMELIRICS